MAVKSETREIIMKFSLTVGPVIQVMFWRPALNVHVEGVSSGFHWTQQNFSARSCLANEHRKKRSIYWPSIMCH